MSLSLRLLLLLLCCWLVSPAQTDTIVAEANSHKIGLKDQVKVEYTIYGKSAQGLNTNMGDFKVVSGPFQSSSEETNLVDGKYVHKSSVKLTYILSPQHTGLLTIGPVSATVGSRKFTSAPLTIEVVAGSLGVEAEIKKDLERDFFELSMIKSTTDLPFIVSAGPVYYDTVVGFMAKDSAMRAMLIAQLSAGLKLYTRYTDLGVYYFKGMPRRFFAVADTENLKGYMNVIYAMDPHSKYRTHIGKGIDWNVVEETMALDAEYRCYHDIADLMREVVRVGIDTTRQRNISMTFNFKTNNQRAWFAADAQKRGYNIVDSTFGEAFKNSHISGIPLRVSRRMKPVENKLNPMADELVGLSEKYNAAYAHLDVLDW